MGRRVKNEKQMYISGYGPLVLGQANVKGTKIIKMFSNNPKLSSVLYSVFFALEEN